MNEKDNQAFQAACNLTEDCNDQYRLGFATGYKEACEYKQASIDELVKHFKWSLKCLDFSKEDMPLAYKKQQKALSALSKHEANQ